MDKKEFVKAITILCNMYNVEFTVEKLEMWYGFLREHSIEDLKRAINDLIKTEKKMPTIAHINEKITSYKINNIPKAEDEWQEVLKAVRRYGSYREEEALKSLNDYTAKIVKYIGYYRICTSTQEEQIWNKKEFVGEYDALIGKLKNDIQTNQIDTNKAGLLNE